MAEALFDMESYIVIAKVRAQRRAICDRTPIITMLHMGLWEADGCRSREGEGGTSPNL